MRKLYVHGGYVIIEATVNTVSIYSVCLQRMNEEIHGFINLIKNVLSY